jgi:hypothetical protein
LLLPPCIFLGETLGLVQLMRVFLVIIAIILLQLKREQEILAPELLQTVTTVHSHDDYLLIPSLFLSPGGWCCFLPWARGSGGMW